ncbi:trehalase-like domain-containing protein, partial [Streptomyces sp. LS1784]|uniref:trehalase-like domain-containing protein n=1 Tax=Streptomyces sp. LS1784 TaxID=2851533 RepID=UPI001CC9FCB2
MPARIEDYALIGDMQTAALVGRDGSVDWLCLPRFDSPAVFAGLLGTDEHGFWRIGPGSGAAAPALPADRRHYRGDSLILEQEWDTQGGTVRVIDFMPPRPLAGKDAVPQVIRIVEGVCGTVRMRSALRMRFSYGRVVPWVHRVEQADGGHRTVAVAGPDSVWLDGEAETYGRDLTTYADFAVSAGERIAFALTWQASHLDPPRTPDAEQLLDATADFWH